MASWHLNEAATTGRLMKMSVFWADDRMDGTVKKACPNFPIILPSQAPTGVLQKYLKRCGRRSELNKSVFILIDGVKYHLFNANQRVAEIYLHIWSKSSAVSEALSVEDADKDLTLYLEVYSESQHQLIQSFFSNSLPERYHARTITNQLNMMDGIFVQEDKVAAQNTKKANAKKREEAIANGTYVPSEDTKQAKKKTKAPKSKRKAQSSAAKQKPKTVIKPEVEPEVTMNPPTESTVTENASNSAMKAQVRKSRKSTQRRKTPMLTNEERETYSPQVVTRTKCKHISSNRPETPSYIDRLAGKHLASIAPVPSTISIVLDQGIYRLDVPASHPAVKEGIIPTRSVLFRTRKGARAGILALDKEKYRQTDLTLYLCRRIMDKGTSSSKSGSTIGREYYMLACKNDELFDAIMSDWGGTPYGYALHVFKKGDLGKKSGRKSLVDQLIKDGNVVTKPHGGTHALTLG